MLLGHVLPKEIAALVWEFVVGDCRKNRARMVHELKMARVALDIKDMRAYAVDTDIEDSIVGIQADWQEEVDALWEDEGVDTVWEEEGGDVPAYLYHSYKWEMTTRKKLRTRRGMLEEVKKKIAQLKQALETAIAQGDVLAMTLIAQKVQKWMEQ
jgi:hypothetical protein